MLMRFKIAIRIALNYFSGNILYNLGKSVLVESPSPPSPNLTKRTERAVFPQVWVHPGCTQ